MQRQAQWVRLLAPETLLLVRFNTQLATKPLPPLEQFGLGGIKSFRGYRQDLLVIDNGAFASAELQLPVLRVPKKNGVLQVIPFADLGLAWNILTRDNSNTDTLSTLASIGLGLHWSQSDRFNARIDWGVPLISVDFPHKTWQENRLYFYFQYNPF
ncbi:MAG: BamA/TamA family outer membrane protein [Nostoc sp.]|uniref:BamA/TamA family outer membrane protein n=1 Tax=Nostoc sp. TaxID=1180 RepID=UPI002FF7F57E